MVKNQRGFSHIEVLMSITIFLLAISSFLIFQGKLFSFSHQNDIREEMMLEVGSIIESLKSGEPIENIETEFDYTYELKEETTTYNRIILTLKHPKNEKYNITFEHYILKQEVKAYVQDS